MQETLRSLGLTENEVKIYLILLQTGTISPSKIAEKTGFSRSYVYDALERLLEKEMVSCILKNNKKQYSATSPKRLLELEKQRFEKLVSIIPHLEDLQGSIKEDIKVELHRGTYVYKILLNDILTDLRKGGEVFIFGINDEFLIKSNQYYLTHLKQYYNRLKKLNIKEKCIVKKNAKVFKNWKTTKYRFLAEKVIGNTAFEVYGNKVAIFLWGTPNHLILIENKEVANSYRNQFEILWKAATP